MYACVLFFMPEILIRVDCYWFYKNELANRMIGCIEYYSELVTQLHNVHWHYSLFCRKSPVTASEKLEVVKPSLNEPTPAFLSSFTTKFCLKLSMMVLNKLQMDVWSGSSATSTLQQLGGWDFASAPSAMLQGDKLPYDQLWQDIIQNLQKGQDARKYIYVTHSELDRLEEHLCEPGHNQGKVTAAVFFTCGHYYTKLDFMKELDRLNKDSTINSLKLPETLCVVREYYGRKGCLPLACPRCVHGAIISVSWWYKS